MQLYFIMCSIFTGLLCSIYYFFTHHPINLDMLLIDRFFSAITIEFHVLVSLQIPVQGSSHCGDSCATNIKITVFWVVTQCSLVDKCQCFGQSCCFHLLSSKWRQQVLLAVCYRSITINSEPTGSKRHWYKLSFRGESYVVLTLRHGASTFFPFRELIKVTKSIFP
jgi:hypothetical protein